MKLGFIGCGNMGRSLFKRNYKFGRGRDKKIYMYMTN